jgi:2-polyprenyl-3-methyl-5-hydroxy-6-metoxy-1,4-benzoquinol methylase
MPLHTLNARVKRYVWDDIWRSDAYAGSVERFQRADKRVAAFKLIEILKGDERILDVGCGSGELLGALATKKPGLSLIGADRSIVALGLARKRSSARVANYICADVSLLPFATEWFDVVTVFGVLEHVQTHGILLAELHRVMKPGGLAFISSSNLYSFLQMKNRLIAAAGYYQYGFQRNWTYADLRQELEKLFDIRCGFNLHADSDMPIIAFLDRLGARINRNWGRYLCFVVAK